MSPGGSVYGDELAVQQHKSQLPVLRCAFDLLRQQLVNGDALDDLDFFGEEDKRD